MAGGSECVVVVGVGGSVCGGGAKSLNSCDGIFFCGCNSSNSSNGSNKIVGLTNSGENVSI